MQISYGSQLIELLHGDWFFIDPADNPVLCPHIAECSPVPDECESPEASCKDAGTEVSG